jgi:hypothetical protein
MKKPSKLKIFKWRTKDTISMLFWLVLIKFGVKRSTKPIPEGHYCYTPDHEMNEKQDGTFSYYIIPCKYYKNISSRYVGCAYIGWITDDLLLTDQCKCCGENY